MSSVAPSTTEYELDTRQTTPDTRQPEDVVRRSRLSHLYRSRLY